MSAYYDFYQEYLDKLQSRAEEAVEDALKKSYAEYFEVANEKMHKMYESTISKFYSTSPNAVYSPRGNLYKLIETEITDKYLSIWFEPSRMHYRDGTSSNDASGSLYDTIFRQGWHGGSMVGGSMMYPVGINSQTGSVAIYDGSYDGKYYRPYADINNIRYGWRIADQASISPLNDFKQRVNEYQRTEYQNDFNEIWNKHKQNITIDMY